MLTTDRIRGMAAEGRKSRSDRQVSGVSAATELVSTGFQSSATKETMSARVRKPQRDLVVAAVRRKVKVSGNGVTGRAVEAPSQNRPQTDDPDGLPREQSVRGTRRSVIAPRGFLPSSGLAPLAQIFAVQHFRLGAGLEGLGHAPVFLRY